MLAKTIRPNCLIIASGIVLSLVAVINAFAAGPIMLSKCNPSSPLTAGSYIVARDLTAVAGCLVIGSDGVALDLGGHTIIGNGTTGDGITDGGNTFSQIIIANGTIKNFGNGINLSASKYVSIDSLTASTNNGIGIEKEFHEKIFGLFERLHPSHAFPGTGLGLAIVRKGVERMGGRVGLESQPRQGSRFWVDLPVAASEGK